MNNMMKHGNLYQVIMLESGKFREFTVFQVNVEVIQFFDQKNLDWWDSLSVKGIVYGDSWYIA